MTIEKKIELLKLMHDKQRKISDIFSRDGDESEANYYMGKAVILSRVIDILEDDKEAERILEIYGGTQ